MPGGGISVQDARSMAAHAQQPGMPTEAVAQPRRRFQFTIKALLVFTAYVAVLLSILVTFLSLRLYSATPTLRVTFIS